MDRIDRIAKAVNNTQIGHPIIEFGLMKGVDLELNDTMTTAGYYEESLLGNPTTYLNATLDDFALPVALAHELRHIEQMMVSKRLIQMTAIDAIKLNRIFEADASTYSVGYAYEMACKTKDDRYLDALDEWEEGDIRDAFLSAVTKHGDIHNVNAFAAGFNQWFQKRERVDHYDAHAIEGYKQFHESAFSKLLTDFNESAQPLTIDILHDVGRIFTGQSYLDDTGIKDKLFISDFYGGNIAPKTRARALSH